MTDVSVEIDIRQAARSVGDGYPLIMAKAEKAIAYKECSTLEEVIQAGFAQGSAVGSAARILFSQEDAPEKIAVYGYTGKACEALPSVITKPWRQLICVTSGDDEESSVSEIAQYIEATDKVYFADISSISDVYVAADETETEDKMPLSIYSRTVLCYYPQSEANYTSLAAAVAGATAGKAVGSLTYKNQILAAIEPLSLSTDDDSKLLKANAITVVEKAGDIVTSDGVLSNGDYIDILDCRDWLIRNITSNVQQLLNQQDKIAYTDSGIALLESTVIDVLRQAYINGMISDNEDGLPDYSADFKTRAECAASDRAQRRYTGGSFEFGLAGAIHTVNVKGSIII